MKVKIASEDLIEILITVPKSLSTHGKTEMPMSKSPYTNTMAPGIPTY